MQELTYKYKRCELTGKTTFHPDTRRNRKPKGFGSKDYDDSQETDPYGFSNSPYPSQNQPEQRKPVNNPDFGSDEQAGEACDQRQSASSASEDEPREWHPSADAYQQDREFRKQQTAAQEQQSAKTRTSKGRNLLSPEEKSKIERYPLHIEKEVAKLGNSYFPVLYTATIMSGYKDGTKFTNEEYSMFSLKGTELSRRLMEELSRELERLNLPPYWLYVKEIQLDRLANHNQFCIHWHIIFINRGDKKTKSCVFTKSHSDKLVEKVFNRIINKFLNKRATEHGGVDASQACNIRPIHGKEGIARYLSNISGYIKKYSTDTETIKQIIEEKGYTEYLPHCWANCDNESKEKLRKYWDKGVLGRTNEETILYLLSQFTDFIKEPYLMYIEDTEGNRIYPFAIAICLRLNRRIRPFRMKQVIQYIQNEIAKNVQKDIRYTDDIWNAA